jgi:membrane protease YdiL (CAAX protease family)
MTDNVCMSTGSKSSKSILSSPWVYFAVAYGWTWTFWILAAWWEISLNTTHGVGLLMLGLCGPAIAGVGLTYLTRDKMGRRDYWQRVTDTRRISFKWYLVIFLFFPTISALAAMLDILMGGSGVIWGEAVEQLDVIPTLIALFLPAFMEELGWRGYALDRLQSRYTALVSSLILGTLWAFWHTPLFFFKDSIQYKMGFGSLGFWTFIMGAVFVAIYLTWIFNNTCRSTLSAILWHAVANGWAAVFTLTEQASNYSVVLWFVAAIAITLMWGPKTFTRLDTTTQPFNP